MRVSVLSLLLSVALVACAPADRSSDSGLTHDQKAVLVPLAIRYHTMDSVYDACGWEGESQLDAFEKRLTVNSISRSDRWDILAALPGNGDLQGVEDSKAVCTESLLSLLSQSIGSLRDRENRAYTDIVIYQSATNE